MSLEKWNDIQLGDHIDILTDYHANGAYEKLKENIILKYEPDYAIMVRTLNFEAGDFDNNLIYINKEEYNYLSKSKVYPNDIVMNKIANAGSVYIMPDLNQPVSLAMNLFLIRFKKTLDQRFMYYLIKIYEPYIKQYANGTATLTITKDSVRNLQFKVPELSTQKKIAKILSSYDDLIENNLKQIKLLEEKARLTYEEWFLRFRIDGQKLEIDKNTGLPFEWEKKSIIDFKSFKQDKSKIKEFVDEKRYLATADIDKIFIVGDGEIITWKNKPSRAQIKPSKNSVWFARMSDTYKVLCFSSNDEKLRENIVLSSGFVGFKAKNELCLPFLYCTINSNVFHELKDLYATGATQVSLNNESMRFMKLIEPNIETIEKFGKLVFPMIKNISALVKQNNLLKESRDILLPRLITGVIDVENMDLEV